METLVSVIIVSTASLVGLTFLSSKEKGIRKLLAYVVAFAVGTMMGSLFFHLLPEMVESIGFGLRTAALVLSGIVACFIMEKFIHWHHCRCTGHSNEKAPVAYMSLLGDACCNLIDGIAIATSYLISVPAGIATTIAIFLHELPQEFGDFGILLHAGFSKSKALLLNFLTALTSLVGAGIVLLASSYIENIESVLLPVVIGSFIYIAGTDLMPELHKEKNGWKSAGQLLALVLGAAVLYAATFLE
jgi:zinc and cadmium transporter